ncbi:hypothetical protein [Streptomonospora arabica]|uniref:Nitroreductase n=1 Tax=Streptomonospora arabica TaxID=412417 RepID=A0ABV9STN3_9ACTN
MRYEGPLPHWLIRPINGFTTALRTSPRWGRLARRRLTVVTYTGRRSGRTFSTPVSYRRSGETVTINVAMPERKRWWRNFTGEGRPISLELDEQVRTGHAVARPYAKGRVSLTVRLDDRREDGESPAAGTAA